MSFSGEIKEELAKNISSAKHCRMAELAAMFCFCGQYGMTADGNMTVGFQTENEAVARKGFTLLQKTFNIGTDAVLDRDRMNDFCRKIGNPGEPADGLLVKKSCCRRAFLRGAFLSVGSVSDPLKGYHLEFVCGNADMAQQLIDLMQEFDIEAKCVIRKKYHVVYLKEGAGIVDLLNVMEAHVALMKLENMRILKEMRNSVNRRVNCETANISKTVTASARQVEDIEYIRDHYGFEKLPGPLREMAMVRLEHPDIPLKELGEYLDPPVGKSGVNHRLRKLSELAEKIRL